MDFSYMVFVVLLLGLGVFCIISRKNMIRILIGLSILVNAVNLNFILLSTVKSPGLIDPLPHAFVVTAIVVDGSLIAVALALVLSVYKIYGTLDVRKLRRLKW